MFILEQLDLFDDHKDEPKQSLWQRIKSLFK